MAWDQDTRDLVLPACLFVTSHQDSGCHPVFSRVFQSHQTLYSAQHLDKGLWQVPVFPAHGSAEQPASLSPSWRSPSLAPGCEAVQPEPGWVRETTSAGCLSLTVAALGAIARGVGPAKWAWPGRAGSRQPASLSSLGIPNTSKFVVNRHTPGDCCQALWDDFSFLGKLVVDRNSQLTPPWVKASK